MDEVQRAQTPAPLWEQQSRQWAQVKPPLRPHNEDVDVAQEAVDACASRLGRAPRTLILGVTPELAAMNWPAETRLVAADLSLPMIRGVWPAVRGNAVHRSAVQADWMAMPFADRSFDLVLGDGCYVVLRRVQAPVLFRSVRRVLASAGMFLIRVFVRPESADRPASVWERLINRQFGNFSIFKFRLLMSMLGDGGEVSVADAWEYFRARCPSPEALADDLHWPVDDVRTIEAYRRQPAIYWFPTVSEFRATFAEDFEEIAYRQPGYEMGECCPTFVLRSRR